MEITLSRWKILTLFSKILSKDKRPILKVTKQNNAHEGYLLSTMWEKHFALFKNKPKIWFSDMIIFPSIISCGAFTCSPLDSMLTKAWVSQVSKFCFDIFLFLGYRHDTLGTLQYKTFNVIEHAETNFNSNVAFTSKETSDKGKIPGYDPCMQGFSVEDCLVTSKALMKLCSR